VQNLAELATQKPFLQKIVENNFQLPEDIEPFALQKLNSLPYFWYL
jgi:hypothetical protein